MEDVNKRLHLQYWYQHASQHYSITLLCTPAINSKTSVGRTFSTAAPQLWNTIPEYIKNAESVATLKTKLETFLFKEYFH